MSKYSIAKPTFVYAIAEQKDVETGFA